MTTSDWVVGWSLMPRVGIPGVWVCSWTHTGGGREGITAPLSEVTAILLPPGLLFHGDMAKCMLCSVLLKGQGRTTWHGHEARRQGLPRRVDHRNTPP